MGCWRERDGSQRPPGRAACTRQHRKRRVDRVETTPRREPTAAGETEQRVTVSVLGGREGCEPADCLPPLPPPLQRDIARRVVLPTAVSPAEDEALVLRLDKLLSRGGQSEERPYGDRDRAYLWRALRLGRGEAFRRKLARKEYGELAKLSRK